MTGQLSSMLPSAAILGAACAIALYLTVSRNWADGSAGDLRGAVRAAVFAVAVQAAHFGEEFLAGFHQRVPALFDQAPMPLRIFVGFNVAWLVIWSLSCLGLAGKVRVALFPLWFLGIGCLLNGVAHPALSAYVGGYFPGLVTSPVAGVAGFVLLRRLLSITRTVESTPVRSG